MKIFTVVTTVILLGGFSIAFAAFNEQINYQGKLTDSSNQAVADGNKCMRFSLYTLATGDSSIWSEEWKASTSYVTTTSGLFSVMLGTNSSLATIDFNQTSLYLQADYDPNCDATYDEVFSPRKRLGAVPAAFEAEQLGGKTWAVPGTIGSTTPNTGAFTTLSASSTLSISGLGTFSAVPSGTAVGQGSLYINPATATADYTLLGLAVGGTEKFRVDAEGDVVAGAWKGTTIGVGYGGTGLSSYATGDMLYASGATTLSKLTIGTANYVLTSSGTAPQWSNSLTIAGLTVSGLTSGRVTYATTGGQLTDSTNLTFNGTTLTAGGLSTTGTLSGGTTNISGLATFSYTPQGIGVSQGSLYINPATATADYTLLGLAVGGTEKFRVDAEGDIVKTGNITMVDSGWIGLGSSAGLIGFDDSTTDYVYFSNANVGIGTTGPDRLFHAELSGTATSDVTYVQRLSHITSGTAAAGFGAGLEFELENASGTNRVASAIQSVWEDATDATEDASLRFLTIQNGTLTEAMRIDDNGYVGIGTTIPQKKLDVLHADSSAQLRLSQTGSVYSEFYVAPTTGNLTVSLYGTSANDILFNMPGGTTGANLSVCQGDACPTTAGWTLSNGGNLILENAVYWPASVATGDAPLKIAPTGTNKELGVYDSSGDAILIFDEATP